MTLGQKIKELRTKAGLTQSELCSECVTRNMLSRIEHDAALPSLGTLREICKKLEISAGYLVDETSDELPYRKLSLMPEIKRLYRNAMYSEALSLCASLDAEDDELLLIKSDCLYRMGMELFSLGRISEAQRLFSGSKDCANSMLYAPELFSARAAEALADAEFAMSAKIPEFPYGASAIAAKRSEHYMYLYMLHMAKTARYELASGIYDTLKFSNRFYKKHISARLSASAHNHGRAITLLSELTDEFEKSGECVSLMLGVYQDLEASCRAASDFEKAYECLYKRNELLEKMKLE